MKEIKLTPAQDYASRMITAIDEYIADPQSNDWLQEILMIVLERPKTLRNALNAYLYKSRMAQLTR